MNTSTVLVALLVLLACATMLTPDTALADRDGGRDRDRQQQSRSEHRENRNAIERKAPQRTERKNQQRVEQQTPRFERKAAQRAEQRHPRRVERKHQRHVERKERREHKPAFVQRKASDHRSKARDEHRRNVETRRSFHIERSHKPYYKRAYKRAYKRVPRQRYYRGVRIYRSYGYLRPGFGFYYSDSDAFRWIAFTALTLAIFDQLNEQQQRMHEQAQIRATTAYLGDTIYWQDRRSSGSITVTDIWHDRRGRECRELEQNVRARGRSESTFSTVCQKRNGVWEVARLN